ncbi:hypothetical protein EON83_20460 [bacterium]|nr:MAG: hypothetical protein EON83_20460 [bacterium]
MSNEANFDALVKETIANDGKSGDLTALDNLYGQVLALPTWHFIARGEFPDVRPYVASHPNYAEGKPMIRAFTDLDRLQRFVKENKLDDANGSHMVVSIPTESIIDYLEQFTSQGVHGIWFNSDTVSDGFFVPLTQLRTIKNRLLHIGWKQP